VTVDDHLRTSNSNIFAAGDISSQYHFTHAAEALGRNSVQNALFFGRKQASNLVVPWCTYTEPEIAHVGLNEGSASKSGIEIKTFTLPLADNDRAWSMPIRRASRVSTSAGKTAGCWAPVWSAGMQVKVSAS